MKANCPQSKTRAILLACFLCFGGGGAIHSTSRAAESAYQAVDLTRFYNGVLSIDSNLPRGSQTFGGAPFLMGGKMEVTGIDAARHGEFLPTEIRGIVVNAKAQRLQLLHGARHGQKDGTPLADLVLHYKNGQSRTNRLAFGVHARNVVDEGGGRPKPLGDPNSVVVWQNSPKTTNEPLVRLYKTELENPLPNEEIATIDFVSLFNRATPSLFAITLQNGGTLAPLQAGERRMVDRANQFPSSAYRAELNVLVREGSNGPPVVNARAMLTVQGDAQSFYFGEGIGDSAGRIVLPYPAQEAASLAVRVSSPGFVPGSAVLSLMDQPGSNDIRVAIERGRTIGGLVTTGAGMPVPNATIIPFQVTQKSSNEYTRVDYDVIKSGSDGRWTASAHPRMISEMNFEVSQPEYRTAVYSQVSAVGLLQTNGLFKLEPHLKIAGSVVNAEKKSVARATVTLDFGGDAHTNATSDANGKFSFVVPNPTNNTALLIAYTADYAPVSQTVQLTGDASPLELVLDSGKEFRMQMVDQNRAPVSGVKVSLERWRGSRAMQWRTVTDEEGRIRWDHAPSGPVTFRYEKPGYSSHTHSMTLPSNGEMTFTYSRPSRFYGKVIDADTRKPVDSFSYSARYRYPDNQPPRWYRYTSGTGRKGSFNTTIGNFSRAEWSMVIEARGYEPYVSGVITNTGMFTNIVELKKGKPLIGVATLADGTPIPKAEVVLLDSSVSGYMDEPGKLRRNMSDFQVVVADNDGKFELTPKPDPDLVMATHPTRGFAQVPFTDFVKSGKIVLQPWGHIKGVLKVGEKVEPYHYITVHTDYAQEVNGRNQAPLSLYLKMKPAADGSFQFDAVPPGNRIVYLRYIFQDREMGNHKLSHNVPVLVKPGETNEVVIGGSGRTVIGKVQITSNPSGIDIDWHKDAHTLTYVPPPQGVPPPLKIPPNLSAQERQELIKKRNEERQAFYREQNRRNAAIQRTYSLVFEDDGTFRIPSVPPGNYSIHLSPTDPRQPNSYRQLASQQTQVTIPEGQGVYDLGAIKLSLNQ